MSSVKTKSLGNPLVTIALLSYNQEKYIAEAVMGVFEQTYSPLEIIISDDCSSDATFEIIERLAGSFEGDHTLILNQNERNLGVCDHLNRVAELANGELLVGAAGDDISDPNRVLTIYEKWVSSGRPSAVVSEWIDIDGSGNLISQDRKNSGRPTNTKLNWSDPNFLRQVTTNCYDFSGATIAYHKFDVFNKYGKLSGHLFNEDQILTFRASLENGILCIDDKLVKYRRHNSNLYNHTRSIGSIEASDRENIIWTNRKQRIDRYRAYLTDIEIWLNGKTSPRSIKELQMHLERELRVLEDIVDWWNCSPLWRIWKLITVILPYGDKKLIKWARRRLGSKSRFLEKGKTVEARKQLDDS